MTSNIVAIGELEQSLVESTVFEAYFDSLPIKTVLREINIRNTYRTKEEDAKVVITW